MESMEYATRSENTAQTFDFNADDFTLIMDENGEAEISFFVEDSAE